MDRLRAVGVWRGSTLAGWLCGAVLVGSAGCTADGPSEATPPPPSRVDAVAASPISTRDLEGFCDVLHLGPDAPAMTWPDMDHAPPAKGTPLWINLWATWCTPCLEEMPRLWQWAGEFTRAGPPMAQFYLSIDDDAGAVARFVQTHPEVSSGGRLTSPDQLEGVFTKLGVGSAAAIPIHVFTDSEQRVRCVRAGGVGDAHRAIVRHLLSGLAH